MIIGETADADSVPVAGCCTHAATLTGHIDDLGLTTIFGLHNLYGLKRTEFGTETAPTTKQFVYLSDDALGNNGISRKEGCGLACCSLGLCNALSNRLGIMGEPGHVNAVGGKLYRPKLDMRLQEETL